MARTPTGNFGTHIAEEVTTTCRILAITRPDGFVVRYTDHDEDIVLVSEAIAATGNFTQTLLAEGPQKGEAIFSITSGNNALNTETVTIGSTVYTFQTTLTDVDGNVQIGSDLVESLGNLLAHINGAAGAGTKYAASGNAHADVDGSLVDITAPQTITLPGAGGGGDDSLAIGPADTGVTTFGNCSPVANALDGSISTRSITSNGQSGLYVGMAFTTARYITKVRIRAPNCSTGNQSRDASYGVAYDNSLILADYNTART